LPARQRRPLHVRILLGMILGALCGAIAQMSLGRDDPSVKWIVSNLAQPTGQVFLRLIFMIVVPLIVSALALGVAEIGDARRVGRVGVRALIMTVALSGIAVAIGLAAVNIVRPGSGIDPERRNELMALYGDAESAGARVQQAREAESLVDSLLSMIPRNPVEEASRALEGGLLPLMVFAIILGLAISAVGAEPARPLRELLASLFAVSLKVIEFAMRLAPVGVFALVFSTAALLGLDAVVALGKYVSVVLGALAAHLLVTYSLALRLVARRRPADFFRQIRAVMLTAFATASSNATLPTALRAAEEEVGLPRDVSTFVLTVGATANQNGTALFEGITVLFLAQFFGIELSVLQQLTVMLLAVMAGVGTAGVPAGSWPMIALILLRVGVPAGSIALVLGIDRILDMSRTVLNVTGDLTIAACVAAMEERSRPPSAAGAVASSAG